MSNKGKEVGNVVRGSHLLYVVFISHFCFVFFCFFFLQPCFGQNQRINFIVNNKVIDLACNLIN